MRKPYPPSKTPFYPDIFLIVKTLNHKTPTALHSSAKEQTSLFKAAKASKPPTQKLSGRHQSPNQPTNQPPLPRQHMLPWWRRRRKGSWRVRDRQEKALRNGQALRYAQHPFSEPRTMLAEGVEGSGVEYRNAHQMSPKPTQREVGDVVSVRAWSLA